MEIPALERAESSRRGFWIGAGVALGAASLLAAGLCGYQAARTGSRVLRSYLASLVKDTTLAELAGKVVAWPPPPAEPTPAAAPPASSTPEGEPPPEGPTG